MTTNARIIAYYDPRYLTGLYGDPRPNGRRHEGSDRSHSTRPGTVPVPALLAGRVVAVWAPSTRHGYGHRIDVASGAAGVVSYAHLHEASPYRIGQNVDAGAIVGHEGTSGSTRGPCCHLEHAVGGVKRDPEPLVRSVLAQLAAASSEPFNTQKEGDEMLVWIKGKSGARNGGLYHLRGTTATFLGTPKSVPAGVPELTDEATIGRLAALYTGDL